jgi:hypothetical protein
MKWMFFLGKCDPQTLKSSSLNTHQRNYAFSFSFMDFESSDSAQRNEAKKIPCTYIALSPHCVARVLSIYPLLSRLSLSSRLYSTERFTRPIRAFHRTGARPSGNGEQTTRAKDRSRKGTGAKPSGVGFGRERKRGPPPAGTATESSSVPN